MKKLNLSKDQIQKLAVSTIGFVVLLYVYFNFFLGPLNKSRDSMLVSINDLQKKVGSSKNEMTKTSNDVRDREIAVANAELERQAIVLIATVLAAVVVSARSTSTSSACHSS